MKNIKGGFMVSTNLQKDAAPHGRPHRNAALSGLFLICFTIAAALIAAWNRLDGAGLTAILLAGLILGALLCLTSAAGVFGMLNKTHALTLPKGSVRAILAFLIIAILVGFISTFHRAYTAAGIIRTHDSAQAAKDAATASVHLEYIGGADTYFTPPTAEDHADLMENVTVTLLTIFASLGAFYFGTRAGEGGYEQGEEEPAAPPTPTPPTPPTLAPPVTSNTGSGAGEGG